VWFLLLLYKKKRSGFGWLYARRARHKYCVLHSPRSRFVLINFSYQTLVFRFFRILLPWHLSTTSLRLYSNPLPPLGFIPLPQLGPRVVRLIHRQCGSARRGELICRALRLTTEILYCGKDLPNRKGDKTQVRSRGKGADMTPPQITPLASPHRPKVSNGSLEPRRREYL
jgi:hypothetical protein